jgi:hypothetical protein
MEGKSVLQLHRHNDRTLTYRGELPDRHVFSARYVMEGGLRAEDEVREPLFTKDENGMDITFAFKDGDVTYRFVGFDKNDDDSLNMGALIYEREGAKSSKKKR